MIAFDAVVLALAVACVSARSAMTYNQPAHKESGFVSVNHDGPLIAKPGFLQTSNGDVKTNERHVYMAESGHNSAPEVYNYGAYEIHHGGVVADPLVHATIVGSKSHGAVFGSPSVHATIVGSNSHGAVVASPSVHATSHGNVIAPATYQTLGHQVNVYGHHQ